jgi:hypothetical protein
MTDGTVVSAEKAYGAVPVIASIAMTEILLWIIAICAIFITLVLIAVMAYAYVAITRVKRVAQAAGRSILISRISRIFYKLWRSRR